MTTASKAASLCFCMLLAGKACCAQRGPGGGGGGHQPGGQPMGGSRPNFPANQAAGGAAMPGGRSDGGTTSGSAAPASGANTPNATARGGLGGWPSGRWWDDRNFAMSIGLRKDQQRKMDDVFNSSKANILNRYNALEREQAKLEAMNREPQPDQARIFSGIDRVNQARAALEKAKAQMVMQLRQQLDLDQIDRIEKFRESSPTE